MNIVKTGILLLIAATLIGCNRRYTGWEYVRIEYEVPSTKCEYKIQEACGSAGAHCFNYFKQRATRFDANTVVITERAEGFVSSGSSFVGQYGGGGSSKAASTIVGLADYYYCPPESSDKIREPMRNR